MTLIELAPLGTVHGVRMPRQPRAETTMRRIVGAVRKLLQYKDMDAIRIEEVASLAGCSPPSIYARFKDKDTFTGVLFELHAAEVADGIAAFLAPDRWRGRSLSAFAQALADYLLHLYRADRNLYRAVLQCPDPAVRRRFTQATEHLSAQVAEALRVMDGGAGRIAPDRVRWALLQLVAALQGNAVLGWMAPDDGTAITPHLAEMFVRAVGR
ncbi:TetR/AcrR family transcriptional regulator [Niveispirillum fermenti]|uniref:TetR/AcrR family transcriptional regulator n=1 Tax=Niveispirillum fermenti TaxID=1233113 RepID=UPI003A8C0DBF